MQNFALSSGGNICLASAGLAEGTNANTIQIANNITYLIDGEFKSKAATNNIAMVTPTGAPAYKTQAINTTALYSVYIDGAGTVYVKQGDSLLSAAIAAGDAKLQYAAPERSMALLGFVKIVTNGSTTFTPASVDLSASGITATYLQYGMHPVTLV